MTGKIIFGVMVLVLLVGGVIFVGYIINSKNQFTLNVSVDNVFSIPIKINIPVKSSINVSGVLVPIDTIVPIDTTIRVPIKMNIPINIKISDLLPIK